MLKNISKSFIINLDRRTDRLRHIKETLPFKADRFSAIDGTTLTLSPEIKKLFRTSWEVLTKNEIACSLSHYRLWKQLATDNEAANYLILEDDVVFEKGFVDYWTRIAAPAIPSTYSLIYLGGCQPWNKPSYPKVLKKYNNYFNTVQKNDFFNSNDHYWHMNAQSYIISKTGASLLCQWVEQHGFDLQKGQAQDVFMINFFCKNKLFSAPQSIYHLYPLMSRQLHEENDNPAIDEKSDLRHATEKFSTQLDSELSPETLLVPKKCNLTKFRCGNDGDGGYVLLKEIFDKIKTVYSYGIDDTLNADSFDICCHKNGKKVYMFNGSITRKEEEVPSLIFTKENVTANNFQPHIWDNGNRLEYNMLLKMDIEGSEYEVINANQDLIFKHFEMICIEFHGINNPSFYNFKDKLRVIGSLLEKYDIFHMHGNNCVARNYEVPNVLEVSLVRKGVCSDTNDGAYPIEGLDFPNYEGRKDFALNWWINPALPFLKNFTSQEIPKSIHLSWRDADILYTDHELIKKGAGQLHALNPLWDIRVYDDQDINRTIRDSVGRADWELIKNKPMTEKTDLWRLMTVYAKGGLYIDIDRYIDTPLSEILTDKTACVLPTFQDIDFSQDFILSCPRNPILSQAILNNWRYRREGRPLFYIAVQSYMHAVSEGISGRRIDRGPNPKYFKFARQALYDCPGTSTYREEGPANHILFRDREGNFSLEQFELEKAQFYNSQGVKHWNADTQAKHKSVASVSVLAQRSPDLSVVWQASGGRSSFYERDWLSEIFGLEVLSSLDDENWEITKPNSVIIYRDMFPADPSIYPAPLQDKYKARNITLKNYFNKFKGLKNCYLIHLSDEHCHAEIGHYKNFKHVFRNYFRRDAQAENVTFFPLGYKPEFTSAL